MTRDWSQHFVRDLIEVHYSGPSPTCEERQVRGAQEWGLLKTTAVTWRNGWDWRQHKVPPRAYWGQTRLEVKPDDVIVTKAGPRHRVGVVAHVSESPHHLMVSGKMIGLRPKREAVIPRILAYALSTAVAQQFLDHRTTGMAESQVNFTNNTLLSTPVELPPMDEQLVVMAILDAVDTATRYTEQIVFKLQAMMAGLVHDLLTRGVDDNGEIRDPKGHPGDFGESPLGTFPLSWQMTRLENVTEGITAPICYGIVQAGSFVPGGQPVLTIGDLDGDFRSGLHRTSSLIDKSYARSRARPGDVLLSIKGTIGRVAVVPSWFQGNISRDLARIRPRRGVRAGYVREFMMSPQGQLQLRRAVVGTTRPEISIHVLKRLLIPLPSPDEQKEIDQRLSEAEQWIRAEKTMLAKLRTLKVGLADDLLTGRVRVTELLGNNVA